MTPGRSADLYLLEEVERQRKRAEQAEAALEATAKACDDFEVWLGAALRALGVKTVFDISDYKTHLQVAIKELEDKKVAAGDRP